MSVVERVQELWGGYGELLRVSRDSHAGEERPVIVKHVTPPRAPNPSSPEGRSHRRKLRSYEVETAFYSEYAARYGEACRVPHYLAHEARPDSRILVLEDVDDAGFSRRARRAGPNEAEACLRWLAAFHAANIGAEPTGLWKQGTYWHLATRPDELALLRAVELRAAAVGIDERLRRARFTTLVHGDAKLDNFCFSATGTVAAVDFQYVGGGVGVKDVVYLLTSCFAGDELEALAPALLDFYFAELRQQLSSGVDVAALEAEWRALYCFAWADWERFFLGWAPHESRDGYASAQTERALAELRSSPKSSRSGA